MKEMKLFKMERNVRIKIQLGTWWMKWLKNRVGQGCIFHVIIPAYYTFSKNFVS